MTVTPDLLDCAVCDEPVDDDERVDCPEIGPAHVRCHKGSSCRDPLCSSDYEEN